MAQEHDLGGDSDDPNDLAPSDQVRPRQLALPPNFFDRPTKERRNVLLALAQLPGVDETLFDAIRNANTGGNPAAVAALTAAVERETDAGVKRAALYGLARIPDPAVIPGLLRGLEANDRACRTHAILALGRLRAREALPQLVQLLDNKRSRLLVAKTLVAIRDERALAPMRRAAAHGWPRTRRRLRRYVEMLETDLGY